MEKIGNRLPVLGFISANQDMILIKSCLLLFLVDERRIEPIVIKMVNQFVSIKFGEVELFDIVNFLGKTTSLDSFLKD